MRRHHARRDIYPSIADALLPGPEERGSGAETFPPEPNRTRDALRKNDERVPRINAGTSR